MQIRLSPSMRSITISSRSNNGGGDSGGGAAGGYRNGILELMKVKVAARNISYRPSLFHTILVLALFLPFVFLLTAVITLNNVDDDDCPSSLYCLGRRLGPSFLGRSDDSTRLVRDMYKILSQVNFAAENPQKLKKLPDTYTEFLSEIHDQQYDGRTFAIRLRAMVRNLDDMVKKARLAEQLHKHYAATSIPKGIHCLSLRLTDEYSSNAHARKQLPLPELLPLLSDNSYYHFVISTDNILAASVVVTSLLKSFSNPEKVVVHVITDKKTYAGMHSWFAFNPISPSIIEVKGVHQFGFLTRENVPVLEAIENHHDVINHYHGNHGSVIDDEENPKALSSRLQARSPKYISILNHLRIYLPELFPDLDKVVFLDDDIVVQHDLLPLFQIDLKGKVNGAVETCRGEDQWVMSKRFERYFNFSHPLIAQNLNPNECAWAYGMNIFDMKTWRTTNIQHTYHYWIKENLKSSMTLWKLGTLPPALLAFRGHVHPIDPAWHMLGLGYQEKTNLDDLKKAAVIHYNGQSKPWLEIGFKHLRPFWSKYVNYSNDFIQNCRILEP
ncbi:Glycosyltransferase [Zostera marina]|uniref:Hexosyltransferase n=1 Tax=Zostera marina TaxID=29655 RepID=A0A0K9NU03_ZOSMR|nr:Glycosyltransferase [Zostera marina]